MTSAVAIKYEGGSLVCCDSRTTELGYVKGITSLNQKKAWKVGNTIIAHSGSFIGGNLLHENPELFEKEITTKTLVNEIVPSIFELFEKRGRVIVDSEGFKRIDSQIIIANSENVWSIPSTGEVAEVDFAAIGSFAESVACYELIKDIFEPEAAAVKIVASLCKMDATVGYPLYVLKTDTDEVSIYKSESEISKIFRGNNTGCFDKSLSSVKTHPDFGKNRNICTLLRRMSL